jgi:hypothetical protein
VRYTLTLDDLNLFLLNMHTYLYVVHVSEKFLLFLAIWRLTMKTESTIYIFHYGTLVLASCQPTYKLTIIIPRIWQT